MADTYSVEVYRELEKTFHQTGLHRPMQPGRYEPGTQLQYDINDVSSTNKGTVRLEIDKFIGGGFAGQVYRVKVLEVQTQAGTIDGIEPGKILAMKILIPPSAFSKFFRNAVHWIGFQGPFQLQVNPAASRAGALWQKFIRRAARLRFGTDRTVVDIYATFVDHTLGSCGELSEWLDGRTWRLEVNDRLDALKAWKKKKPVKTETVGSPEYRSKYEFMHNFVSLLHEMGAYEFARQYEWTTWKSQPNCLKRSDTEGIPTEGLTAVDFRAGLALLPFLPMSPGDVKLIFKGFRRGALVQFDRGSIKRLEEFIAENPQTFSDMHSMLEELKISEKLYRASLVDITHHHFRLLYSPKLWSNIFSSLITGWKVRALIDDRSEQHLRKNFIKTLIFAFLGIIPFIGRFFRRIWGQPYYRKHYGAMFSSWDYLKRAFRGKLIEKIIGWYRAGRLDDQHAISLNKKTWKSIFHIPLSILPIGIHRLLTDFQYLKDRLAFFILRPIRLYFNADMRAQWLRDMVTEGKAKHLLTNEDANVILSQIDEPFIQKYLKSLAVHVCTLPVTQVVSLALAVIYILMHPELPRAQAYAIGFSIVALFQVTPVSPGSLVRGLYVVYLVIRERNFKDYNIAVFLGFFKYIGYLAFPIQMTYRYPALARFMAGHWATDAVHIVPVFGERGALLEHSIFSLFYNLPLTIRRKIKERTEIRSQLQPRYWHVPLYALAGTGLFLFANTIFIQNFETLPVIRDIWPFAILIPLLCGMAVTLGAAGAPLGKRVTGGAASGSLLAILYTLTAAAVIQGNPATVADILLTTAWFVFIFTIVSTIGVIITEINLPGKKVG